MHYLLELKQNPQRLSTYALTIRIILALYANERHKFVECKTFIYYNPQERSEAMKQLGRCCTCLAVMHKTLRDCKYQRRCPCQKSDIIF